MEKILLAGVCPICYAYVMVAPGVTESEVITCDDCKEPLTIEHVSSRKTVSFSRTSEVIPL